MEQSTWKKVGLGCGGCLGLTVLGFVGMITLGVIVSDNSSDGVAESSSPTAEETISTVQEPSPTPQEVDEEPSIDPEDILSLILASGWHELSTQEQVEICQSWALSSEVMVEAFMEGYGEDPSEHITDDEVRTLVRDFYDEQCE